MNIHKIGEKAEQAALLFLEKKGLTLLARNYRCKLGEIDLIMRDNAEVVFIEVRQRSHPNYSQAAESVTHAKQRKIIKTATHYLQKQHWLDKVQCRFDVIGFSSTQIEWIQDAFCEEHD